MKILTSFEVEIENLKVGDPIKYVDDGSEYIETINDVGCNPSGRLVLQPFFFNEEENSLSTVKVLRKAIEINANLGLYHALSILNKNSNSISDELRHYKILFPGTLRIAANNAFIPTLFFSRDINARWRISCHWFANLVNPKEEILLKVLKIC